VLNAIYETDFLGFSYGFRPGRSQHQALDALYTGLLTRKVNWVLDLDIRGFFDGLSHEWLVKFIEHRIADRRVVRLIQKWLNAGVLEDGKRIRSGRRDAPGRQCFAAVGQRLSPLRVRPVGPSVASEAGARRCDRGAFCGRHRGWI
jgi:retron-type reverse transcriptase